MTTSRSSDSRTSSPCSTGRSHMRTSRLVTSTLSSPQPVRQAHIELRDSRSGFPTLIRSRPEHARNRPLRQSDQLEDGDGSEQTKDLTSPNPLSTSGKAAIPGSNCRCQESPRPHNQLLLGVHETKTTANLKIYSKGGRRRSQRAIGSGMARPHSVSDSSFPLASFCTTVRLQLQLRGGSQVREKDTKETDLRHR